MRRISRTCASFSGHHHHLWVLLFLTCLVLFSALSRSNSKLKTHCLANKLQFPPATLPSKGNGYPPILAYWIYGSHGDINKILRLVKAIYHPRNQYLLQLDADSTDFERAELANCIQSVDVFQAFGNVNVVGKSDAFNQIGSSILAATLHAAALLLKLNGDWDWFITLSASDYPLMTQDDILHALASIPRDLSFIRFTKETNWKERINVSQIVVDPSLYFRKSAQIVYASEARPIPNSFKIYGGSQWMILTRAFMEYCIQGWENLPRMLLMYYTNVANPLESYFHTLICNSPDFQKTTLNIDLSYTVNRPSAYRNRQFIKPLIYDEILSSGAAFTRPFQERDPILNVIDERVLKRAHDRVVPGKWCSQQEINESMGASVSKDEEELCSMWGDIDSTKAGPFGRKLKTFLSKLTAKGIIRTNQCHYL